MNWPLVQGFALWQMGETPDDPCDPGLRKKWVLFILQRCISINLLSFSHRNPFLCLSSGIVDVISWPLHPSTSKSALNLLTLSPTVAWLLVLTCDVRYWLFLIDILILSNTDNNQYQPISIYVKDGIHTLWLMCIVMSCWMFHTILRFFFFFTNIRYSDIVPTPNFQCRY